MQSDINETSIAWNSVL